MKRIGSSVVAIVGSLLLLSTAFAQVKTPRPTRISAKENSTRFRSETDKFEVVMPVAPTVKKETRVISGQQLSLTYYGAMRGESDYAVLTLVGFNEPNWHVAHMLMLDFYSRSNGSGNASPGARSASSFKAAFQRDISLDDYAGRQFSLEAEDRIGEWRIYEVDKTFYAVAASRNSRYTASRNSRYASSFRGFFDSFSLSRNDSTVANADAPAGIADTPAGNKVSNPTARWLIILQTFSPHERSKANQRMNVLRGQGYDTQLINTDSYAKLRPGLLALTMGPFSKRAAQERLGELRSVAPQSYIKAGW
ncbi:MAG: hypothetical protein LC794_04890 [Acidobacteria bacterium]|nr:hypothetical protein [Acidobacteriota bacterium]